MLLKEKINVSMLLHIVFKRWQIKADTSTYITPEVN